MRFKRRKNFLPTLLLALLLWAFWFWLVFSAPPTSNLSLLLFYFSLFGALFLTTALVFANSRRGFLTAAAVICFLIFRYYQLANILNLLLLFGLFLCLELYLTKR